ncbi:MAG: ABC transporter permease [Anaerolineae bacterium]
MATGKVTAGPLRLGSTWLQVAAKTLRRDRYLYAMMVLPVAYFAIFHYVPMYGITLAFKDFDPTEGIMGSPWVGLKHVKSFLQNEYSYKLIWNTVAIRLSLLAFSFPCPIILALLLNELRHVKFKRIVQTCSYLPHFISVVVVCGMIVTFLASSGPFNQIVAALGGTPAPWLQRPEWFRAIYVTSDIWQGAGWGSVLYLAALTAISPDLYEAAVIDGAGRWQRMFHITLPGIAPTITIMLLLNVGQMVTVGYQKILLLYSGSTYETADVLGTYIYRRGITGADYGFATAVGLFQSIVGLMFVVGANYISRKLSETSLW